MTKFWLKNVACAALILASASANAQWTQVYSTVKFSGLTFSVYDMTPDDGIAAAFSLTGGSNAFHLAAQDLNGNVLFDQSGHSDTVINPLTEASAGGGFASAWSGATGAGTGLSFDEYAEPGKASANSTSVWEFNLAPGTALMLTGVLDYSGFRDGWYDDRRGGDVKVSGLATLGNEQASEDNRAWGIYGNGSTGTLDMRWTLFNGEDHVVAGALSLELQNSIYTYITPATPEPSTYLMLATGGLLTAAALRRLRRRVDQA